MNPYDFLTDFVNWFRYEQLRHVEGYSHRVAVAEVEQHKAFLVYFDKSSDLSLARTLDDLDKKFEVAASVRFFTAYDAYPSLRDPRQVILGTTT